MSQHTVGAQRGLGDCSTSWAQLYPGQIVGRGHRGGTEPRPHHKPPYPCRLKHSWLRAKCCHAGLHSPTHWGTEANMRGTGKPAGGSRRQQPCLSQSQLGFLLPPEQAAPTQPGLLDCTGGCRHPGAGPVLQSSRHNLARPGLLWPLSHRPCPSSFPVTHLFKEPRLYEN